ncbi:methyltransferase domain-containing protein [Microcoleus sp.]|uniref:methyltransferase domain-containing protein n=1 Tax=Microcoleus sp. TaxID=44472 RepID=UPI00403E9DCD
MKLDSKAFSYIEGKSFSDVFALSIEQLGRIRERMEFVEDIVNGKSVLHIGCLDHVPLIESRIQSGIWFHLRLTNIASECLGIDINQGDIDFVREKFHVSNIYFGDIISPTKNQRIISKYWDYVVLGEVLEHIDNPVYFLNQLIYNYGDNIGKIVITVPNALRFSNIRRVFKNLEVINSDHRYWFTPYTIWKVVNQAGLFVDTMQLCTSGHSNIFFKEQIRNIILARYPLLADGIVIICHQK